MARNTTVDTTEERNTFVLELLRAQPEMKSGDIQEKLKSKFGATVSSRVLNQLREQAQAEAEAAAEAEANTETQPEPLFEDAAGLLKASATESQGTSAPAQRSARAGKGARVKHVFIEAPKEQLEFLERVVAQLQEAGVANLRVDHGTDRWLVFSVDAK